LGKFLIIYCDFHLLLVLLYCLNQGVWGERHMLHIREK